VEQLPKISRVDVAIGVGLMVAPAVTVVVGALLGFGREIPLVAMGVFFLAGWLNDQFPPKTN
jgi:hypothetical protein